MNKLCTFPGCNNIVEGGDCRCPQHPHQYTPKKTYAHHYHNGKNIYKTSWWKKLRSIKLSQRPMCEICERMGIYTPATVVDHIIEIKDGGEARDINNLQSLCRAHHNQKTGEEAIKRREKKKQNGFKSLSDF